MVHIESLNLLIQGVSFSLFFTNYQEGIIKKWFFMLGQIIALPIIYITHGPKCFHELFVDHLFGIQDGGKCSDYSNFNGAIRHYIKEIKGKKMIVCCMLEANIVPQIDVDENINQFCSYFHFTLPAAAILDSKDGIKSIAPTILEKHCCFKKFFAKREEQCTLNQLRGVLKYICSVEGP